jgi:hypothetical protein
MQFGLIEMNGLPVTSLGKMVIGPISVTSAISQRLDLLNGPFEQNPGRTREKGNSYQNKGSICRIGDFL